MLVKEMPGSGEGYLSSRSKATPNFGTVWHSEAHLRWFGCAATPRLIKPGTNWEGSYRS